MPRYSPTGAGIGEGISRGADRIGRALADAASRRRYDEDRMREDERWQSQQDFQGRQERRLEDDRRRAIGAQLSEDQLFTIERGGGMGPAPGMESSKLFEGVTPRLGLQRSMPASPPVGRLGLAPGRDERQTPLGPRGTLPEPRLIPEPGMVRPVRDSLPLSPVGDKFTVPEPKGPLGTMMRETGGKAYRSLDLPSGPGYIEDPQTRTLRLGRAESAEADRQAEYEHGIKLADEEARDNRQHQDRLGEIAAGRGDTGRPTPTSILNARMDAAGRAIAEINARSRAGFGASLSVSAKDEIARSNGFASFDELDRVYRQAMQLPPKMLVPEPPARPKPASPAAPFLGALERMQERSGAESPVAGSPFAEQAAPATPATPPAAGGGRTTGANMVPLSENDKAQARGNAQFRSWLIQQGYTEADWK